MDFPELREKIMVILNQATVGIEQLSVSDKMSTEEVWELSAKIGTQLPRYPDLIIDEAKQRVFDCYTKDELPILINTEIINLFKLVLRKENTKEHILLLVFYLIYKFKMDYGQSFIEEFQQITPYFNSYIMYSLASVKLDIIDNPVQATTREVKDWYIRVKSDYTLVPTTTTQINFKQFLYNH